MFAITVATDLSTHKVTVRGSPRGEVSTHMDHCARQGSLDCSPKTGEDFWGSQGSQQFIMLIAYINYMVSP